MASSIVELVNNALVELGEVDLITALTQNTRAAIIANQKYPAVRDAVLRSYPWNCAIARQALSPLGTTPAFEWSYQFNLPPTCLRILALEDPDMEYTIEGRKLLANSDDVKIKFIQQVTDVTQFDALLSEAISSRLAHALALPITQSNSLREAMWENYRAKLREARSVDAQENMAQTVEANEWVDSRTAGANVKDLRNPV